MRRGLVLMIAGVCWAQRFDSASVRLVDPGARPSFGSTRAAGRVHYGHATMIDLLTAAFGVASDQIAKGPYWVRDFSGSTHYALDATMPAGTTDRQFQAMMQKLLAERFHLAVHHESRRFEGYELSLGADGAKLKEAGADAKTEPTLSIKSGVMKVRYPSVTMGNFAGDLGRMVGQALGTDLLSNVEAAAPRVADRTGLSGRFEVAMEFACAGCRGASGLVAALPKLDGKVHAAMPSALELPTIFEALAGLGLRLEKVQDVAVDVVVIDRIERVPR